MKIDSSSSIHNKSAMLPNNNAQVLTSEGFNFLHELESIEAAGDPLPLFAVYNVKSARILYCPGTLVVENAKP